MRYQPQFAQCPKGPSSLHPDKTAHREAHEFPAFRHTLLAGGCEVRVGHQFLASEAWDFDEAIGLRCCPGGLEALLEDERSDEEERGKEEHVQDSWREHADEYSPGLVTARRFGSSLRATRPAPGAEKSSSRAGRSGAARRAARVGARAVRCGYSARH